MLSKRLYNIASMVSENKVVADVGSDHGLLPCFLVKEELAIKAYAIDNKPGPLKSSIENIRKYNLEDHVIPILSDGLKTVDAQDIQSLVIAGMGYLTIKDILEADLDKVNSFEEVILQSNTEVVSLRQWIIEHHYQIVDEKILKEKNKFYFIIKFKTEFYDDYQTDDYLLGPVLRSNPSDVYQEYLSYEISSRQQLLEFNKTPTAKQELESLINFYKIFE